MLRSAWRRLVWRSATLLVFCVVVAAAGATAKATQSVTTYHYDAMRTGWNAAETMLTPTKVPGLSMLKTVAVDEQVDAQPLLVPGLTLSGQGTHDALFIATENDTVDAIDAESGAVLLSRNFGVPVPQSVLPGQCNNNSVSVGINSTPVMTRSRPRST
jgi:hypothetical protein